MLLFYYYKTEKEMIALKTNWDEVLNEILEGSETLIESTEAVKDDNIKSGSSLLKPVKLIDIPPNGLEDF